MQHCATSDPILAPALDLILAARPMRAGALASLDFAARRDAAGAGAGVGGTRSASVITRSFQHFCLKC